jgi:hypothetical protein
MAEQIPLDDNLIASPEVRTAFVAYGKQFALELLTQAQLLAYQERSKVDARHLNAAWDQLRNISRRKRLKRLREALIFFGGVGFSVLAQTLLTSTSGSIPGLQVLAGIAGLTAVGIGLTIEA